MGKNKHKKKKPSSHQGPTPEQLAVQNFEALNKLLTELKSIDDKPDAHPGPLWGDAHKILLKAKADPTDVIHIITDRNIPALERMIGIIRGDPLSIQEAAAAAQAAAAKAAAASARTDLDPELLKNAMRAFRKRLKLTQLDHESKLGVGPLSGGKAAGFDAIIAPNEFPSEVWQALAAQGRLRDTGQGFYKLIDK